jgi:hypothetical protein
LKAARLVLLFPSLALSQARNQKEERISSACQLNFVFVGTPEGQILSFGVEPLNHPPIDRFHIDFNLELSSVGRRMSSAITENLIYS